MVNNHKKHGQQSSNTMATHRQTTWSTIIKNMVNNHQTTWSTIIKTHGKTSSNNMVKHRATTITACIMPRFVRKLMQYALSLLE
jgi:hypothetical protein